MAGKPDMHPDDKARVFGATRFVEALAREGVNGTVGPPARPRTPETVVWPVRVTGSVIEEGEQLAGLYPAVIRYPNATMTGWVNGPAVYILPLAGQTLGFGDEGVGRYVGRTPDPDDPEAEGAIGPTSVFTFSKGGTMADQTATVTWDAVTAVNLGACTVTTSHFALTVSITGGILGLLLLET